MHETLGCQRIKSGFPDAHLHLNRSRPRFYAAPLILAQYIYTLKLTSMVGQIS